jgi:hypothetical protein
MTDFYFLFLAAQEAIEACDAQDEPRDTDGVQFDDSGERANDYYATRVGNDQ